MQTSFANEEINPSASRHKNACETPCDSSTRAQKTGHAASLSPTDYYEIVDQFAHDVRSPHCVISEYAALIREGIIDGEAETDDALASIRNRVAELQLEVDALLLVARLSSRKVDVELESCDAAEIMREAVARLKSILQSRGVGIEIRVEPDNQEFYGDSSLVRVALVNLLWSILRAVPSTSNLCIIVDRNDDDRVRFAIAGPAMKRFEIVPRGLAAQARMAAEGRRRRRFRVDIALGIAWELTRLMHGELTCGDDSIEVPTIELLLPSNERTAASDDDQ